MKVQKTAYWKIKQTQQNRLLDMRRQPYHLLKQIDQAKQGFVIDIIVCSFLKVFEPFHSFFLYSEISTTTLFACPIVHVEIDFFKFDVLQSPNKKYILCINLYYFIQILQKLNH